MGSSMGGMAGILGAMVGRIVYCREQHRFGVGRLTSPVQYCNDDVSICTAERFRVQKKILRGTGAGLSSRAMLRIGATVELGWYQEQR